MMPILKDIQTIISHPITDQKYSLDLCMEDASVAASVSMTVRNKQIASCHCGCYYTTYFNGDVATVGGAHDS